MEPAPELEFTPQVMAGLWKAAREKQVPPDESLVAFQRFMILHEDMHDLWDKLAEDPSTSLQVGDDNLLLHIAMDAATEKALERNEPEGLPGLYALLVQGGFDEGRAFHVIAQAMAHEFMTAASQGQEMSLDGFMSRAKKYTRQAIEQKGPSET